MQKIYALIGLSVISFSLSGMESKSKNIAPKQPDYTVTIEPMGGYLKTNFNTQDIYANYGVVMAKDIEKIIHYRLVEIRDKNGKIMHTNRYSFKTTLIPTVPLKLFTENKEYITEHKDGIVKIISHDKLYMEDDFVPYNTYWEKNV